MNIYIIIPHYGNPYDTMQCLKSIKRYAMNCKPVVVDNADNFVIDDPSVKVLKPGRNLGFAGGCNLGMTYACIEHGADYVLILNNDATLTEHCVESLIRLARMTNRSGVVAPKIVGHDGKIWACGGFVKWTGQAGNKHAGEDPAEHMGEEIADYASGCAMLITRDAWQAIGGFDERYYLYYEDVDYCTRLRERGLLVIIDEKSTVVHAGGKSSNDSDKYYYSVRNQVYYMRSHVHGLAYLAFAIQYDLRYLASFFLNLAKGRPDIAKAVWDGHIDALLKVYGRRPSF